MNSQRFFSLLILFASCTIEICTGATTSDYDFIVYSVEIQCIATSNNASNGITKCQDLTEVNMSGTVFSNNFNETKQCVRDVYQNLWIMPMMNPIRFSTTINFTLSITIKSTSTYTGNVNLDTSQSDQEVLNSVFSLNSSNGLSINTGDQPPTCPLSSFITADQKIASVPATIRYKITSVPATINKADTSSCMVSIIAAIVLGVILAVIIAVFIGFIVFRIRRSRSLSSVGVRPKRETRPEVSRPQNGNVDQQNLQWERPRPTSHIDAFGSGASNSQTNPFKNDALPKLPAQKPPRRPNLNDTQADRIRPLPTIPVPMPPSHNKKPKLSEPTANNNETRFTNKAYDPDLYDDDF